MELKYSDRLRQHVNMYRSNRTFMELKWELKIEDINFNTF